jgi:hypothetical protein
MLTRLRVTCRLPNVIHQITEWETFCQSAAREVSAAYGTLRLFAEFTKALTDNDNGNRKVFMKFCVNLRLGTE